MSQQPEEVSFWEAMSDTEDSIDAPTLDANSHSLPPSESRDGDFDAPEVKRRKLETSTEKCPHWQELVAEALHSLHGDMKPQ
eukprot:975120-Amphidinium_carterae.1